MKLLYSTSLVDGLRNKNVFVDTSALINASHSDEFLQLLAEIRTSGCQLFTIPSVVYEFAKSANSISQYQRRLNLVKDLDIVVFNRVEELLLKDSEVFTVAYNLEFNKSNRGPSYTDSILCTMLYKHRNSQAFLLTSNHKDMPLSIFDRTEIITIENNNEFYTEALYKFSDKKFKSVLTKLEAQAQKL